MRLICTLFLFCFSAHFRLMKHTHLIFHFLIYITKPVLPNLCSSKYLKTSIKTFLFDASWWWCTLSIPTLAISSDFSLFLNVGRGLSKLPRHSRKSCPPTSASRTAGIAGLCYHARLKWPFSKYKELHGAPEVFTGAAWVTEANGFSLKIRTVVAVYSSNPWEDQTRLSEPRVSTKEQANKNTKHKTKQTKSQNLQASDLSLLHPKSTGNSLRPRNVPSWISAPWVTPSMESVFTIPTIQMQVLSVWAAR